MIPTLNPLENFRSLGILQRIHKALTNALPHISKSFRQGHCS